MTVRDSFNRVLDWMVRPEVRLFGLTRSTFLVMGYVGLFLACLLAMSLVMFWGLAFWLMGLLILTAVITFLSLNMAVKIISGWEMIVCIHHQVAVLLITTLLLRLLNQPVLPYLAITMLGVGVFIGIGRLGCLMVGCCHGRPGRWGVCYRQEHAEAGFAPYFVGVRFFPIQAVASLLLFGNVIVGTLLVLLGNPGAALVWYLVVYCTGRFILEFFRGDPARPYYRGLSEPQWNALVVILGVLLVGMAGGLPVLAWQIILTVVICLLALVMMLRAHFPRRGHWYYRQPRHVQEVAELLMKESLLAAIETPITLDPETTSLGLRISAGRINGMDGPVKHYALSAVDGTLSAAHAADMAALILQLQHPTEPGQLVAGNQGVFHLLIQPQPAGGPA